MVIGLIVSCVALASLPIALIIYGQDIIMKVQRRSFRKRVQDKPQHSVWYEANKRGGYTIFAGIKGTDVKTYAGSAMSRTTLDYNMRKAKMKFGLSID